MERIIFLFGDKVVEWGPGLLIGFFMLYGLYRLTYRLATGIGLKIVGALEKPSEALNHQAQSMDRLTISIQEYVHRDANEHQEIIILQKVIRQELRGIREQSNRIEQTIGEMNHGGPQIRNS